MLVPLRLFVGLLLFSGILVTLTESAAVAQEFPREERREIEDRERQEREREMDRREQRERELREREENWRERDLFSDDVDRLRPHIGERAEAFEQRRREMMEREHHRSMLEGHRLDFEMHKLHMERVATQARIADDAVLSAAFALERLPELVPDGKQRREILGDFLDRSKNPAVKRLIRMKLLEIPAEGREREEQLEVIESLIE